jgi:hypothetical protein
MSLTPAEQLLNDRLGRRTDSSVPHGTVGRSIAIVKPRGFAFTTYKTARAGTVSKRWILKGLLAWGETSGWVGPPGSLKSSILASVAVASAAGEDWCGKRNKGACAIIYFALERADLVKRRLRAYDEKNGIDLPIAVVALTINLMDEKVVDEIVATIDAVEQEFGERVGLLIVDTLPKGIAAGGGDEDKARDHGKVYANIQRVKDRRGPHAPHVALICHPGKDASRGPRGSNASTGDFDVQIEIAGTDIRTATITKNNDGPEGFLASFKPVVHDFGKDEDGDPIEVCLAEPLTDAMAPPKDKGKARGLPKAAQIALRALGEALEECGGIPPASNHIPAKVRTVLVEQWRQYAYRRGISTGEERAKQQAFKRATELLIGDQHVGHWDVQVWLTK